MTIFTAVTLGTITTIYAITNVDRSETFSALRELNKKEEQVGCGVTWSLCRNIGDVAVDYYSNPCHHVRVERIDILDALS
jgi:hypothetical protein